MTIFGNPGLEASGVWRIFVWSLADGWNKQLGTNLHVIG